MNPVQELIRTFQDLVAQVPEIIQPVIVMLAGTVPFIEGELASMVGIAGGLNPIVAAIAAAVGNFASVALVVLLTSRARTAAVNRRRVRVMATAGAAGTPDPWDDEQAAAYEDAAPAKPESKGRQRVKGWLVRFGVPGASILGPLAIPTQITSSILVASGTPRGWVLLWQAVAIVLWTTVTTVSAWAALTYLVGV